MSNANGSYHIPLDVACDIVKNRLRDDSISRETKWLAVDKIVTEEGLERVSKDDLADILCWILDISGI